MKFKEDGSQWYNYFYIRQYNDGGYYFAWIGSKRLVFSDQMVWRSRTNAVEWILGYNWKEVLDTEFEKEILDGSK